MCSDRLANLASSGGRGFCCSSRSYATARSRHVFFRWNKSSREVTDDVVDDAFPTVDVDCVPRSHPTTELIAMIQISLATFIKGLVGANRIIHLATKADDVQGRP